jgi:hypothetical protein
MGGYCLQSSIAWRFQLPEALLGRATLNALEFLAAFVGVLVEFSCEAEWTDADVILSPGDSISAAKWLASSSFDNNCPMHLAIARSFAIFCLSKGIDHYTQWFSGKENTVADILSRDFALFDEAVTKLIRRHCSPLVPQSFRINHPFDGNDHFSQWRIAAAAAQHKALADSTHAKRNSSWHRGTTRPFSQTAQTTGET